MTSDRDSLSTLSSSPVEKFACMFVKDGDSGGLEWYAFDVSDDAEHNQPLPPPLPAPYCCHYGHLNHFHLDDGAVNLKKPKATRSKESGMGFEWAILGSSLETETKTLYLIRQYMGMATKRGRWVPYSGNRLERIDLISSSPTTRTWKPVPSPMLNPVYSVQTVVLGGKLYFLGCVPESEEDRRKRKKKEKTKKKGEGEGEEEEQPWAIVYDPNLKKWEALPEPPIRPRPVTTNLFTAATQFPTPYLAVGSISDSILQIYRLDTKVWELDAQFNPRGIFSEAERL